MPKLLRDVRALNETKALVLEPGTAIDEPPLTKHSNSQSLVVPSLELLALQVITGRIMSNYITSIWGAGGWDDILEEEPVQACGAEHGKARFAARHQKSLDPKLYSVAVWALTRI